MKKHNLTALIAAMSLSAALSSTAFAADGLSGSPTADLFSATSATAAVSDGYYEISLNQDSSKGLNIQFASKVIDEAHAVVDNLNEEPNEVFHIINRGNGLVSIHPKHAEDLCLNAQYGAHCTEGTRLQLHNYEAGDEASLWELSKNNDGYLFKNKACGLVIDLNAPNGNDDYCYSVGNFFQVWSDTGLAFNQRFNLVPVGSSGSSVSSDQTSAITDRLNSMISGAYGSGTYQAGTRYRGTYASEQCKGFAKQVHKLLFGYNIGSTKSKPNNDQLNISSGNTALVGRLTGLSGQSDSKVSELFSQARPGDFVQLRRSHGGSHSAIFLSSDGNSVTLYECNVDGNNGIRTKTYSCASFRSSNSAVSIYTAKDYRLH